ncbi:MAG: winged helix DNA-binding domain-containing protein [Dehalococcoidia bacterium]
MNDADIARFRLHAQQIATQAFDRPEQVVAWLGAVQAQDYAGALWAVGLRLPCGTIAEVEQALADGTIVRTWPMRGTLHFVAAADVRWLLNLLTPRIVARSARRHQQLELDDAVFARGAELFTAALHGGRGLTRPAMYQLLEADNIPAGGQRGIHILGKLAQEGLICFGARAGKQQTFVLLDEWAPAAMTLPRDEALAEVARRYFTGHGPAALPDFVWWSGLPVADARAGLEMVKSTLAYADVDGQRYWMSADVERRPDPPTGAYLLPGFDEYLLGYRDRTAVLDPEFANNVNPGSNGMFSSTVAIDGRITGTWRRTFRKNAVSIAASPFTAWSEAQIGAVGAAGERYGRFLGLPVVG